jgi:formylglycine-generating enzyme required for sulfatase activity
MRTITRRTLLGVVGHAIGAAVLTPQRAGEGSRPGEARQIDGVALRWCPPGRFTMGSPPGEPGRRADEAQVEVTLTRGFWIAAGETTQGQWRRVLDRPTDRPLDERFGLGDDVPVYWVSYDGATAFCRALTERARRSGAIAAAWAFALPTEAQWEYACRAGTTGPTAFGDGLTLRQANFTGERLDGTSEGPGPRQATPAGRYPPNAWGIHDMHGNLFEWCRDWYHARLPGGVDPDVQVRGEPNGDGSYSRVRRGGAWNDPARFCRSALRLRYEPHRSSDHIGFRVALVRA